MYEQHSQTLSWEHVRRGGTHLHGHGDVLLADVVVVLVCVQHDNSISQGESCIIAHERRAVYFLKDTQEAWGKQG